jgi:hypothetical protein
MMRSWDERDYNDLIQIPEGQVENFTVRHRFLPAGEILRTSTLRTAMFGQPPGEEIEYDHETRWHSLREEGAVWMTDMPIEQAQHRRELAEVVGDVLVGGLGLGVGATMLANDPLVSHVTVIEKSPEVVELVAPHITKRLPFDKLDIVVGDLFEKIPRLGHTFDWAFYDIWASDGQGTLLEMVLPLVRSSVESRVVEGQERVICWNEDVMRGQLQMGLHSRTMILDAYNKIGNGLGEQLMPKGFSPKDLTELSGNKWHDWAVPFFQWLDQHGGSLESDEIAEKIRDYAEVWGRPGWEGAFEEGVWGE